MEISTEKQHIINLIKTGEEANIELAFQLTKSQKIDLSDFLKAIQLHSLWNYPNYIQLNLTKRISKCLENFFGIGTAFEIQHPLKVTPQVLSYLYDWATELNIRGYIQNELELLPNYLFHCTKLNDLSIVHSKTVTIPKSIIQLKKLYTLNFWKTQIEVIPEFITKLDNLRSLSFRECPIINFPTFLHRLPKLETIAIVDSLINSIPNDIIYKNVKHLSLHGNQLTKFSPVFQAFPKLKTINLSNNPIPNDEKKRIKAICKERNILLEI